MAKIEHISSPQLTWIDITHPKKKDLEFLSKKHKFFNEDIEAALPSRQAQRPHVAVRDQYLFIAALFPRYDKQTRSIYSSEVDVFISKDHLVTVHDRSNRTLNAFFKMLSTDKKESVMLLSVKPTFLFYELLDRLYHDVFPMLDNVNRDIKNIENRIFAGDEKRMIKEILVIKNNILNFKRIMQAHRSMIKKLLRVDSSFTKDRTVHLYYTELLDHVKDIWTLLETYEGSVESLENTNNAIVGYNMNQVITTLTVLTVLVFPLTILGGIFGMNARNMPIIGHMYDFWIIVAIMASITVLMYIWFKKRGWI